MHADNIPFRAWLAVCAITVLGCMMRLSYNSGVEEGIRRIRCDDAIERAATASDSLHIMMRGVCSRAR